jgi:acetyl-CoA carboxylase biotin carboxyl carrier protein
MIAKDARRRTGMARLEIRSEISGRVWKIEARSGDRLDVDTTILIIESMKMEIPLASPAAGLLVEVCVAEKDMVEEGQVVAVLNAD